MTENRECHNYWLFPVRCWTFTVFYLSVLSLSALSHFPPSSVTFLWNVSIWIDSSSSQDYETTSGVLWLIDLDPDSPFEWFGVHKWLVKSASVHLLYHLKRSGGKVISPKRLHSRNSLNQPRFRRVVLLSFRRSVVNFSLHLEGHKVFFHYLVTTSTNISKLRLISSFNFSPVQCRKTHFQTPEINHCEDFVDLIFMSNFLSRPYLATVKVSLSFIANVYKWSTLVQLNVSVKHFEIFVSQLRNSFTLPFLDISSVSALILCKLLPKVTYLETTLASMSFCWFPFITKLAERKKILNLSGMKLCVTRLGPCKFY